MSTKNTASKIKIFFIQNYKIVPIFRGFEQLSSSTGWRVMAFSQIGQGYLLWDLNFCPISYFWAIMLAPDMLASPSRALKTRTIA